ncbi:MAG: hypothetical protein Q8R00_00860 [Candidatus Nanoarchaeia archaeon]|nr:hypothetical protein [Candidatus Nanoarchaeia archaeon]
MFINKFNQLDVSKRGDIFLAIDINYIKTIITQIRDAGAKNRPQAFDSINLDDLNPLEKAISNFDSANASIVATVSEIDLLKDRNSAEGLEMERVILPEFKKQKGTRLIKLEGIYAELSQKYPLAFNGNGYNGHKNGSNGKS